MSSRDQTEKLQTLLPCFESLPISYPTKSPPIVTFERVINLRAGDGPWDTRFLYYYDVFPRAILSSFGSWENDRRPMKTGDCIVIQARMPPWACSLKMIFGVRVVSCVRLPDMASFSYRTLRGHPEAGENTFALLFKGKQVIVRVQTQAAAGTWWGRLAWPAMRLYVEYANRQALQHITAKFIAANREKIAS